MLQSIFKALQDAVSRPKSRLNNAGGLKEMLQRNWYLGLTSFGGPAVHFQIFNKLFVEKYHWLDNGTYQEMFALCQALPGPGSTKMLYAINALRHGFWIGVLAFFIWSVPAAIAAYGLSRGVENIGESLPGPVSALLSGLNAATVGIIALAAVQLSQKAITDKITRVLVFLGATAGMLYNALWYFPVLMVAGGLTSVVWDYRWGHRAVARVQRAFHKPSDPDAASVERDPTGVELQDASPANNPSDNENSVRRVGGGGVGPSTPAARSSSPDASTNLADHAPAAAAGEVAATASSKWMHSWRAGLALALSFLALFTTVMILRGLLRDPPRGFSIFANLFLAGTIIFGGGPVVIPLLREYVVAQGWVSPRDFLLGLAIIQAFPGPNFNFAVYLGSLATVNAPTPTHTALGALLAYLGIFSPGLVLHTATMGVWAQLRRKSHKAVFSTLRGVNAAAVGLVYSAVYRLWEVGFLDPRGDHQGGESLGRDPWWVVITATSFVGGMWFNVSAPVAIVVGGVMGLIWYAVVLG